MQDSETATRQFDAVVVGAGFTGMYVLHQLRKMGLKVIAFEAGGGVGGTWYWNRYPGARVDCHFPDYQYTFSKELFDKWEWSETFPAQPETERYLNFCADELDLRENIHLNTRVSSAAFDESSNRWQIETDSGETCDAQYFIPCTGILSAPVVPFPGKERFTGLLCHTAQWPTEPVDFAGKRVGVVGNGATGMQVISTIAPEVEHLKVFLRTAQYAIDLNNPELTEADREDARQRFPEIVEQMNNSFNGQGIDIYANGSFHDHTPEERHRIYERIWAEGTLRFWIGAFADVLFDEEANREISDFVRNKIREHIDDPEIADRVTPTYRFGTRRVPLQNGYYDAFNRDNVELVDVKEDPVECITENGLKLGSGVEHELDILVLATGFDAGRTLARLDVRGRRGVSVKEIWDKEVRSTMGLQLHGFPNMFTPGAPLAPIAAFCNVPHCSQQQGDWIVETIRYLRDNDLELIEPSAEVEQAWVDHHDAVVDTTLFPKEETWYMGDNMDGKTRRLVAYPGVDDYAQRCEQVRENGYEGFFVA